MGKDIRRRFVVSLDISTKDAEKQIKSTVGNLKEILADMGKASNKMGYFKELADYLAQVDSEIDRFKQKHGDGVFNQVFGGLDSSLRAEMEKTFGTAKAQMDQLEQIRNRMAQLGSMGDTDAARAEMKALEQDARDLFAALGKADDIKLSGRGKLETRLANMEAALDKFALVWDGVNDKIKQGFSFDGVGGAAGGAAGVFNSITKEVQEAIDKLKKQQEEYEEIIRVFGSGGEINISLPKKSKEQISHLESLKAAFEEAGRAKQRLEAANMTGGEEYLEAVANYTRAAAQLKAGLEHEDLSDGAMNWVNQNALDMLEDVEKELDNIFNKQKKMVESIQNLYSGKITNIGSEIAALSEGSEGTYGTGGGTTPDELTSSYDKLKKKVQEYYEVLHQRDRHSPGSGEYELLNAQLDEIVIAVEKIKQLDNSSLGDLRDVFGDIEYGDIRNVEDALTRICDILQIEIPAAAGRAGDSIEGVMGGGASGTGGGTSSPDDMAKKIEDAKLKLQEFTAIIDEMRSKSFDFSAEDNVEIGRYTERLEIAKKELDALGEQGLITANEIEAVNSAFSEAKDVLENRTVHYTGYGSGGYTYSFYEEYQAENDRANALEEENARLKEELSSRGGGPTGGGGDGTGNDAGAGIDSDAITSGISNLENTVKTETDAIRSTITSEAGNLGSIIKESGADSLSSKLDGTFKVDVVKDYTKQEMQNALNGIKQSVDKIALNIDQEKASVEHGKKQSEIDNMKQNLLQLLSVVNAHNAGRDAYGDYQGQELGIAMLSDGSFSVNHGNSGSVSWDKIAESMLANLNSTLLADIHTHPLHQLINQMYDIQTYVSDSFSGSGGDLSAMRKSKSLGAQIFGMITGNVLKTIDISKLSMPLMKSFADELKQVEKEYADSGLYSDFIGVNDKGQRYYKQQDSLEKQHAVTKIFENMMYEAFERVGVSNSRVDNEIYKKYNLTDDTQLTELAIRLVELTSNAKSAIDPLARLQDIIKMFGGDMSTQKAKDLLAAYDKGEIRASDVFNQVVPSDKYSVNDDIMQSLMRIDSSDQVSSLEAIVSNISNILSAISSSVNNIELNTSKNASDQIGTTIDDITAWVASGGNISGNLTSGIKSVYDANNRTDYKYKDVAKYAYKSNNDFLSLLDVHAKGGPLTGSDLGDMFALINSFKTALSHMQDLGKQAETLGYQLDTVSGEYIHPDTGEMLSEYGEIRRELLNVSDVIEPFVQMLTATKASLNVNGAQHPTAIGDASALSGGTFKLEVGGGAGLLDSEFATLNLLKDVLDNIVALIAQKNRLFGEEADIVGVAVQSELDALNRLYESLATVLNTVNDINRAFDIAGQNADELSKKTSNTGDNNDNEGSDNINDSSSQEIVLPEGGYALDATLNHTNDILGQILGKIADGSSFAEIIDPLKGAVEELKKVAAGIKDGGDVHGTSGSDDVSQDSAKTPFDARKRNALSSVRQYHSGIKDTGYYEMKDFKGSLDEIETDLKNATTHEELDKISQRFKDIKKDVDAARNSFKDLNLGIVNSAQKALNSSFDKLENGQQEEIRDEYQQVLNVLERYKISVKDGNKIEISAINSAVKAIQDKMAAYQELNDKKKDQEKNQKKSQTTNEKYGSTAEINALAKLNALRKTAQSEDYKGSKVVQEALKKTEAAYTALEEKKKTLNAQNGEITKEQKAEFKELQTAYNEASKALNKILTDSQKLHGKAVNPNPYVLGADFADTDIGRKEALTDFVQSMYGVSVAAEDFKNNWNEVVFAVANGDGTFTQMTATFDAARTQVVALAGDTKKATTFIGALFDEMKGKFRTIFTYLTASFGWQEIFQQVRKGVQYVKEIDSALTELKKVTDETDAAYAQFLQDMSNTGSVVGATVADLTTMASEWARLGYSMEEAGRLAESTAILLNVSEFTDATQASEALISTMQAFQYTADESQHVVDILNEIGNNYAVSSDGLAIALQDSASALMEGGNNLEQAVALVAAANKVVKFVPRCYSNIAI